MKDARLVTLARYVDELADGFNSGLGAETTYWRLPVSRTAFAARMEQMRSMNPKAHRFAILWKSRFVGTCSLFGATYGGWTLAIAIFDPAMRGKGIGTFAVRSLCDFGFRKLKARRIELGVYPHNERAIAVYTKCGFKHEALLRRDVYHDGRWRDSVWMSLLRDEWKTL